LDAVAPEAVSVVVAGALVVTRMVVVAGGAVVGGGALLVVDGRLLVVAGALVVAGGVGKRDDSGVLRPIAQVGRSAVRATNPWTSHEPASQTYSEIS